MIRGATKVQQFELQWWSTGLAISTSIPRLIAFPAGHESVKKIRGFTIPGFGLPLGQAKLLRQHGNEKRGSLEYWKSSAINWMLGSNIWGTNNQWMGAGAQPQDLWKGAHQLLDLWKGHGSVEAPEWPHPYVPRLAAGTNQKFSGAPEQWPVKKGRDFADSPKYASITIDNFKQFAVEVRRLSKCTDHPPERRAVKLITFLPKDIARHFLHVNDDNLTVEESLTYVVYLISIIVGIRPGDKARELMDQIWNGNALGKDESLAAWLIRQTKEFMQCGGELGFEIPVLVDNRRNHTSFVYAKAGTDVPLWTTPSLNASAKGRTCLSGDNWKKLRDEEDLGQAGRFPGYQKAALFQNRDVGNWSRESEYPSRSLGDK